MKQPYTFIAELLPLVEQFQRETGNAEMDMPSFAVWLSKRVVLEKENSYDKTSDNQGLDSYISGNLLRLSKYAKYYSKQALCDSKLNSIDDFVILTSLMECESKRKTELISENLMEFTSGIGILRRLLKFGFITEFDDDEDKRSKRVKLTNKGIGELQRLLGNMQGLANIITGDLTDQDKFELLTFLEQLDRFHQKLYFDRRTSKFRELLQAVK